MKKAVFFAILLSVGIFLAGAPPAAADPSYTCKKLIPLEGSGVNLASGINNAGQVVGYNESSHHAFLYRDGVMQDLGTLPAPYDDRSYANNINDAGVVVGYSIDLTSYPGISSVFKVENGEMTRWIGLPPPPATTSYSVGQGGSGSGGGGGPGGQGGTQAAGWWREGYSADHACVYDKDGVRSLSDMPPFSQAHGLNYLGDVVGGAGTNNGNMQAFLYRGGAMQPLGTLPAPYNYKSVAYAINAKGQIVGDSYMSEPTVPHAFLYDGGAMKDLGTLPAPYDFASYAKGINAAGQVAGYCYTSSYSSRAFLYSGGVMLDLNSLVKDLPAGVVLAQATGINDRGQIVVNAFDGRAYILTPVAPPAGLNLLLLD
jgi:probable HAF family extracellular repeat protein